MYIENRTDVLGLGKRQLEKWNGLGPSTPCLRSSALPSKIYDYPKTKSLAWRPSMGTRSVELVPLSSSKALSRYSSVDPLVGMTTQPLKFPSLVTGLPRNSPYSSQTTLCTRFTPNEWYQKQVKFYNEADSNRYCSERMRSDAVKIMREAEERVQDSQYDTSRRIGERISEVTFWRNEISSELEKQVQEIENLQDCRSTLEKAVQDIENPLHVAEECLFHREARKGTELVHDEPERALLREVEVLRSGQKRLENCLDKCKDQLRNCRISQNQLELDLKNKDSALNIDLFCHQISNASRGLQYYSGIEQYDPCVSKPETWAETANRIIQKSQAERTKAAHLRVDAETLINRVAQEMWDSWNSSNSALSRRCTELVEAKSKLQQHLHKVQQEVYDVEKNIELLRKAIADKSYALKVAHTRLEARTHRPDFELCRDNAYICLQREIEDIYNQVERMHKTLRDLENQHQRLLRTRNALEHDLALKVDATYIDKDKVCGLRRSYPVNAMFRF
ncbi:tektin-3-like [Copidosoma floridanum]|uniref:tektin-3-like n=1 Tax=Copidosoma floridanum TaxID=29053 RepID=UPI0006C9E041|nr:tektin-3-like [Copidosoma floridanum]